MKISFALAALAMCASSVAGQSAWKKTVLDTKFRSEGVAVADIDKDGKKDILVGDRAYLAPDWKPLIIRQDREFNPTGYSQSFAVFAEDVDKDGWMDQIVVGFPGAPCHWYKNPGKAGGEWKAFVIQDNACNETPIYVDLLGTGTRGLILGHKGEMAFFHPGKDPTAPWTKIAVGTGGKVPGTDRFAHGLGAGDVNGDGRLDVICAGAWWEQPASNAAAGKWTQHPLSISGCADIYAHDVDGDGKNDLIASAAHDCGFWWHQQKENKGSPAFVKNSLFPTPQESAKLPGDLKLSKDEVDVVSAINKIRGGELKAPWRINATLCRDAKSNAVLASETPAGGKFEPTRVKYPGEIVGILHGDSKSFSAVELFKKFPDLMHPGLELGVGVVEGNEKKMYLVLVGDNGQFALPGQTHALQFQDIDGDGLKDLITGRRYWAHGPRGDHSPADPALLYWFKAKKDKTGMTTFEPRQIDDASGIGTQFAVEDVDGDGKLDVVISNKRGVFLFLQAALAKND